MKQYQVESVVTHVKRIEKTTGITKIMTVGEVMEEVGEETKSTLQRWGKFLVGDYIYHVIDSQEVLFDILGRSVVFEMRNGETRLIKVRGIGFLGIIAGVDHEGMNVSISVANVDEYRINRKGMH